MRLHTQKGIVGIGLVIAIVAVLAVAGGGYAYWHNKNKTAVTVDMRNGAVHSETNKMPNNLTGTSGTDSKKIAFSEFIKQNGSYECTVTQSIDGMDSTGTVWLNNGLIRGDYSVKVNGSNISGSTIIRDGFAYTWSSAFPMGFKVPITEDINGSIGANTSISGKTYSWDAHQIGAYNCDSWKADASKFAIPSTITFQTIPS